MNGRFLGVLFYRTVWALTPILALAFAFSTEAQAQNAATPGTLEAVIPTLSSAGFAWPITGDDNGNARVTIRYRRVGDAGWSQGLPFMRVEKNTTSLNFNPGNYISGSLLNLTPATQYEAELTLSDADGGSSIQTKTFSTRAEPAATSLAAVKYIIPGSGGGDGSAANPYKGLAAADTAAIALPGTVFILKPGNYGRYTFQRSGSAGAPITYRGENPDTVIFDGSSSNQSFVVDLSSKSNIVLENLSIKNSCMGLKADDSQNLVLRRLKISVVKSCEPTALQIRGNANNAYICDNTLLGAEPPLRRDLSNDDTGISVAGTGHEICNNDIRSFYDAIDTYDGGTTYAYAANSVDIHHNLLLDQTDDGIETDGSRRNIRVFRNLIANSFNGISAQPNYGGPNYIFRNEIYNVNDKPFKFHNLVVNSVYLRPSGSFVFHNSTNAYKAAWHTGGVAAGDWGNSYMRNNLFFDNDPGDGTYYSIEGTYYIDQFIKNGAWYPYFDYNGWAPQSSASYVIKLNNVRYKTFNAACDSTVADDFCSATGNSRHDKIVTKAQCVKVENVWGEGNGHTAIAYRPGDWDFSLVNGAAAIDAGVRLPNLNDDYLGANPDLGALEKGAAKPLYGPRPLTTDTTAPAAPTGLRLS
ncbi:MAG: hypothetical protein K1X83_00070 [Oligoflexia bacterium]|nr:hypothetical protein [Oligoflexia bacterium]